MLSGLALTGAGLVVHLVQSDRIDDDVNAAIEQEMAEFGQREKFGDPDTGRRYDSAIALMLAALKSNVPSEDEVIAAFWRGELRLQQGRGHAELLEDPEFRNTVVGLSVAGGVRDIAVDYGDVRVAVKPVLEGAEPAGALVFAYHLDPIKGRHVDLMRTYAAVAGAALLAVAAGAHLVAGRLLRPVRHLREAAQEITETDLTRRLPATGNDDLTDLTVTFNDMLDRLDGAMTTQRQFLDDVGHELKTPITIVNGHLELMQAHDVSDVQSTRELVLDEMDRMSRLVGELMLLAKSRRPDFLKRSDTDLGALTDGLLDKVRGLAPRDWQVDERADGRSVLDAQRITQAVLQLASNAVRHTEESDVIAIGSRIEDGTVTMWVRDTGEGVAPEIQDRIFERFTRGTDTGEGGGLGLAIVRAIAEAHGGSAAVRSAPGGGATFLVRLPWERVASPW